MARPLVIVESPAKARTISRFLGNDYAVEASVGHIRDLPSSASEVPASVRKEVWSQNYGIDVEHDFAPYYVVPKDKKPQVKKLKDLLKDASAVYLATDEDREGESISWHLLEVLKPKVPVHRLVFHEITRDAIQKALASPRSLDMDRVRAQETRRIVDRLFGYDVSPLLWRKIRPQLSAGRVQSVAVRLVVERERARLAFVSADWWDVSASFAGRGGEVDAALVEWKGNRVATGKDFGPDGKLKRSKGIVRLDEKAARGVVSTLTGGTAVVDALEEKPYTDRPAPPFTTSTLQQEANRKIRWSARKTMSVAQRLYENGWITYMRTDSTILSDEAIAAARSLIKDQYGAEFLPRSPRHYKSTAKNAQEAHEAIRPAGSRYRSLDECRRELGAEEARLYELIWKRTVACQMEDATGKLVTLRVAAGDGRFEAKGKTIEFPGFRRAYVEGSDDPEAELADKERILPTVTVGEQLQTRSLDAQGHNTQPPPRLTEATLVKELESRGIGRPSTYASIIDTILRREYVFKKGNALVPTFTAFAVTGLLEEHLGWLVDYGFTASMEEKLDDIATGEQDPTDYLRQFYLGKRGLREKLKVAEAGIDPRTVCTIEIGERADGTPVAVRVGKFGPFLSAGEDRADIPDDLAPDELSLGKAEELLAEKKDGPKLLGEDPASGDPIYLFNGRFGYYVQRGENPPSKGKGSKTKPPRSSLLKGMVADEVDLATALALLSLPRDLGPFPDNGEAMIASNGRFGPYVKAGSETRSIPATISVLDITAEQAIELLKTPRKRRGPELIRGLGTDESTGRTVQLMDGRFGPYVTDGETNASLRKGTSPDGLDLAAAVALIRAREGAPKKKKRAPARKRSQ